MYLMILNFEGLSIADIIGVVGLAAAFLVALAGVIKAVKEIVTNGWTPTKQKFQQWWKRFRSRRKMLREMQSTLNEIRGELRTNGGSTLKDAVMRVDGQMGYIQARLRNQDETASHPIFDLNADGDMTVTNCAFRELVNADDQELLYRKFVSRVHPDDRTRLLNDIDQAKANVMPLDSNVRFRTGPTSYVGIRLFANPDVRSGGQLMGFFGTASKLD